MKNATNRPNTIRIKVSDEDFRQAQRGLIAHAAIHGCENGPTPGRGLIQRALEDLWIDLGGEA